MAAGWCQQAVLIYLGCPACLFIFRDIERDVFTHFIGMLIYSIQLPDQKLKLYISDRVLEKVF